MSAEASFLFSVMTENKSKDNDLRSEQLQRLVLGSSAFVRISDFSVWLISWQFLALERSPTGSLFSSLRASQKEARLTPAANKGTCKPSLSKY